MRWNLEGIITPTDVSQKKKKCHFQKLNVILRNFICTKKNELIQQGKHCIERDGILCDFLDNCQK